MEKDLVQEAIERQKIKTEQPKYLFPDLQSNPGGLVFTEQGVAWLGINTKVADYLEASAILDDTKLKLLSHYKNQNQKMFRSSA